MRRLPRFLVVGAAATAFYGVLYVVLRLVMEPQWANAVALVVSTLASTDGNRRFTFHVHDRATVVPHQVLGLGLLVLGLAMTGGSLWLLDAADPDASRVTEVLVLAAANGLVGTTRFVTFTLIMREPRASL